MQTPDLIVDRTDEELRASGCIKWAAAPADVLPAWVAEMDFAVAEPIAKALHEAVSAGAFGYPGPDRDTGLPDALADFAAASWGWVLDPELVLLGGDVIDLLARVLTTLCEDAPVVVPTPAYPPFLAVPQHTGRALVTVPVDLSGPRPTHDLDAIDAALAKGARTVVLCNPHNPWGRAFQREELEALRDVADARGAMVVSDEIHAPLVLPGAHHVPYATVARAESRFVTLVSATKSWNLPGLKCAQVVCSRPADAERIAAFPLHPGQSSLGTAATRAAYRQGGPWLEALVQRLDGNRRLFADLVARHLPGARMWPLEATYLAWLDARSYGLDSPGRVALEHGRVWVDHRPWGPGWGGFVRVNLATSTARLEQVVDRLAAAWER